MADTGAIEIAIIIIMVSCASLVQTVIHIHTSSHAVGEGRVKWAPRPKSAPSVTVFLVRNVVEATVVVFTDPPGDINQRRIYFFGAIAKR